MPTDRSATWNTSAACRYPFTCPDSSAATTRNRTTSRAAGATRRRSSDPVVTPRQRDKQLNSSVSIYALLAVHQAVLRITDDAVVCRPGLDPDRISVTVALETARDEVLTASGILAPAKGAHPLIGAIGNAVLDRLLPPRRRRLKARIRKGRFTKYCLNAGKTPVTQQQYTVHTEVVVMEEGLTNRSRR
ncbi:hypothetical protein ACH4UT_33085 [Streptomyces sp. NPDC020799]|uniref:hypothetical protein n=1 Tax=Streptomyces sp. NPDC020799 TaxID=3365091 RepID=UPI0037BB38D5